MTKDIRSHIIDKACEGDEHALHTLYNQYSKSMYNICFRMLGNRLDAEDILQECFIIGFEKIKQLRDKSQFGGWLKRITVNACIKELNKRIKWENLDDFEQEDHTHEMWWSDIPLQQINSEIEQLPDGCRQIFILFVLEDFSHREIASSLGITESTSKSQYFRAKKLLRDRIRNYYERS